MVYTKQQLMKMKLPEIKQIGKENSVPYSNTNKPELVERILKHMTYVKCVSPTVRSPTTNRCGRSPCSKKETRDKETKQCRDKKSPGRKKISDKERILRDKKEEREIEEILQSIRDQRIDVQQLTDIKKCLKTVKTNDKSGIMSKSLEIPCDSFKGKSSCENEYGEEYDDFKLRRCKWNQSGESQVCEVLPGSLDDRLRVTLGLSTEEFAVRRRTIDQKNELIKAEIEQLRSQNPDIPIDFTKAKKQVIQNREDGLRLTHQSASDIQKQVGKVSNEIVKNKDINPVVKYALGNVIQDLAVVVETEKQLLNAKAGKNKGLNNLIDLEAMLKKKQASGAKTDKDLENLGKGFEEIPLIDEKIETLENKMNESRQTLMDRINRASKEVSSSNNKTREELSKISMSVGLLASITSKPKECQMGKIWDAVLEKCMCRNDEMESEEGICMNKKIRQKSDSYMSQGDSDTDTESESDDESDFEDFLV